MSDLATTIAAISLALSVGASSAQAGILASGTFQGLKPLAATEQALPLTNAGATAVTFNTRANNTLVAVTYHAQCTAGGEPGDYMTLRIAVDGVDTLPRAGANFALCSAVDRISEVGAGVSRQAFILVPRSGPHTVQVFGSSVIVSGASRGRIEKTSIVIQD